jgi:hypothetical protein
MKLHVALKHNLDDSVANAVLGLDVQCLHPNIVLHKLAITQKLYTSSVSF